MTVKQPNLGATFGSFAVAVAAQLGMAVDATTKLPVDPDDAATVLEVVKDAWAEFLMADGKHQWRFMDKKVYLTFNSDGESPQAVNGESWRYKMPWYFTGRYRGDWEYQQGSSQIGRRIRVVPEEKIMQARSIGANSGTPQLCAFVPREDGIGYEAQFWPDPVTTGDEIFIRCHAYSGTFTYSDRQFAGPEFDSAVKAACLYVAARDQENANGGPEEKQWMKMLAGAITLDKRNGPKTVGSMNIDQMDMMDMRQYHGFHGVQSVDGVTIPE